MEIFWSNYLANLFAGLTLGLLGLGGYYLFQNKISTIMKQKNKANKNIINFNNTGGGTQNVDLDKVLNETLNKK